MPNRSADRSDCQHLRGLLAWDNGDLGSNSQQLYPIGEGEGSAPGDRPSKLVIHLAL
jgi:hypothetical protein